MCRFNVHENKTADGVVIVLGLEVVTNEWKRGVVVADNNQNNGCCQEPSHKGQQTIEGNVYTDHSKRECDNQPVLCHHDHWFEVEYTDGSFHQFNGERLGARIPAGVS